MPALRRGRSARCDDRPVPAVAASGAAEPRSAADLERRRRHELVAARVRAAAARLRSGSRARRRIIVRRATAGEPFSTLDGVARTLDADDLVIADAEGPSALAGVMGGQDSEIRSSTRRVLLESAYFTAARRAPHGTSLRAAHRGQPSLRTRRGLRPSGARAGARQDTAQPSSPRARPCLARSHARGPEPALRRNHAALRALGRAARRRRAVRGSVRDPRAARAFQSWKRTGSGASAVSGRAPCRSARTSRARSI